MTGFSPAIRDKVCICCGFSGPRYLLKLADDENYTFRGSWVCRSERKCRERSGT